MRTHMLSVALGIIAFAGLWLTGCASWSTYPPVETTARFVKPVYEPIPSIAAESIRYAREHYANGEDVAINLPTGAPPALYDRVLEKLGGGEPMREAGENAIHVTEIRTRGFNAQADVIYTRPDGLNRMVTLTLQRSVMSPYRVVRAREWAMRNLELPAPTYVASDTPAEHERNAADNAAAEPEQQIGAAATE